MISKPAREEEQAAFCDRSPYLFGLDQRNLGVRLYSPHGASVAYRTSEPVRMFEEGVFPRVGSPISSGICGFYHLSPGVRFARQGLNQGFTRQRSHHHSNDTPICSPRRQLKLARELALNSARIR